MKLQQIVPTAAVCLALFLSTGSFGQHTEEDIDPSHHPNLAEAQRIVNQAYHKIGEAQRANENDLHGHADKAKRLLLDAGHELKLAADDAPRF